MDYFMGDRFCRRATANRTRYAQISNLQFESQSELTYSSFRFIALYLADLFSCLINGSKKLSAGGNPECVMKLLL